jgi:hypothetical protein
MLFPHEYSNELDPLHTTPPVHVHSPPPLIDHLPHSETFVPKSHNFCYFYYFRPTYRECLTESQSIEKEDPADLFSYTLVLSHQKVKWS